MFEVFGSSNCAACASAKDLLISRKLTFTYLNIEEDEDALDRFTEFRRRSVPLILRDGQAIGGFEDLKNALMDT